MLVMSVAQEIMAVIPLVEVQSSRTQRPNAGTSYPYVDLTVGDVNSQKVVQLQLEQVHTGDAYLCFVSQFCRSQGFVTTGLGVVPCRGHAGGEHDVFAGEEADPASQ